MALSQLLGRQRKGSPLGDCLRYTRSKLHSVAHEKRVMDLASRLFDLTQPDHGLSHVHRSLLRAAALLHDIGRCQGPRRHHIRGQSMILADRNLPFSIAQRQLVAFLTRYHRKKIPGRSRVCRQVPDYSPECVLTLLALIKAADALDSRKAPPKAILFRREGNALFTQCFLAENPRKTIHALSGKRKYKLLGQTLNVRLNLKFVGPMQ